MGININNYESIRKFFRNASDALAASSDNAVYGITSPDPLDGNTRVKSCGYNENNKLDVSYWRNIVKIKTTSIGVVGLTSDGRLATAGDTWCYNKEQSDLDISDWSGIKDFAKSDYVTAGLKKDGTVIAKGSNDYKACEVSRFSSIVQLVAGKGFVAGLRADGTVAFAGVDDVSQQVKGSNIPGAINSRHRPLDYDYKVSGWQNLKGLYVDDRHESLNETIVGLTKQGTVLLAGKTHKAKNTIEGWKDIIDIFLFSSNVVGIKKDGSIVASINTGKNPEEMQRWFLSSFEQSNTIVDVQGMGGKCVLLRSNGTVDSFGLPDEASYQLKQWKNIVAIKYLHSDDGLVIGLKADGRVVQTSYAPRYETDEEAMTDALIAGTFKDMEDYKREYRIDTSDWQLKAIDLDTYILAIKMMLDVDYDAAKNLLGIVDYYANAHDLQICLNNLDDRDMILKTAFQGVKDLFEFYQIEKQGLDKVNGIRTKKLCTLLETISELAEAKEYLDSLLAKQKSNAQAKENIKVCPNCRTENSVNANFCFRCGKSIKDINNSPIASVQANPVNDNWSPKTMDDMYFAAIEGNVHKLREILRHQPELLTEQYKTINDDGNTVNATAVFSILVHMKNNGVNYWILNVLCEFGVNFNQNVYIYYKNRTRTVKPLLMFTIDWDHLELTQFLLEHGANPNAFTEDTTESTLPTKLSMLYFAIDTHDNLKMVHLLLSYGANPQMYCEPFIEKWMVYQKIPPLYYSVVKNPSIEMTALLLQFGASTSEIIDVGRGLGHASKFWFYVKANYPNNSYLLHEAERIARSLPTPTIKLVYRN